MVNDCARKYSVDVDEVKELVNDRVKWMEFTRSACEDSTGYLLLIVQAS